MIKTYILNSVEDFCNVIFEEEEDDAAFREALNDKSRGNKFEMKEYTLKMLYEKFCFLNHYPERALLDNNKIFQSYGYHLVPDTEAIAFLNLVERKNIRFPSQNEITSRTRLEIFDLIFSCVYERSNIDTDFVYFDEIESSYIHYCKKLKLPMLDSIDVDLVIKNNSLKLVKKAKLKLVCSHAERKENIIISTILLLANSFFSLILCLSPWKIHFKSRKQKNFYINKELLLEYHDILVNENKLNTATDTMNPEALTYRALKRLMYYPWWWIHEIVYIMLHMITTSMLILPFVFLAILYEVNYEPYSTISFPQLISV